MQGDGLLISMEGLKSRLLLGFVRRGEFAGATMNKVIGHATAEPASATNKMEYRLAGG